MNKKPRFFCDNCGNEVGNEVKNCPYCGRFFASVRCPSCGHSGPDEMFQNGCPMCGYSTPPPPKPSKTPQKKPPKIKKRPVAEPIPFWTYAALFIALFAVIALLSYFITR
ncbi:MAG: zinc ribbon domain-containing protein [Treponema sp.]|nr:zinc ribbon domain-containing protein [Treponema sp.]